MINQLERMLENKVNREDVDGVIDNSIENYEHKQMKKLVEEVFESDYYRSDDQYLQMLGEFDDVEKLFNQSEFRMVIGTWNKYKQQLEVQRVNQIVKNDAVFKRCQCRMMNNLYSNNGQHGDLEFQFNLESYRDGCGGLRFVADQDQLDRLDSVFEQIDKHFQ